MDIISFSEAATANSRIEICNANSDSTSGIVTVPKVVASGETITIPAGRVAVLPNVQIDGILNVEGEVFIPSGATLGDLDAQLALKAPLVNPAFTNPTATTQAAQDNSTKVATTAYVDGKMVLGTAVNSTSGTSIDFTGIPSWAKKITVMFSGVSTNSASNLLVQIGSGSVTTTGYYSQSNAFSSAGSTSYSGTSSTNGFIIFDTVASYSLTGHIILTKMGNNQWVSSHVIGGSDNRFGGGTSPILSNPLDRIRITTVNGTDTFDAGQINIMYEG